MPTDLENLLARRSAILAELAALTSTSAGGGLNHTALGRSFDHVGYKDGLYRELAQIKELIGSLEGPIDDSVQGYA